LDCVEGCALLFLLRRLTKGQDGCVGPRASGGGKRRRDGRGGGHALVRSMVLGLKELMPVVQAR